jgi:hypothetical protein
MKEWSGFPLVLVTYYEGSVVWVGFSSCIHFVDGKDRCWHHTGRCTLTYLAQMMPVTSPPPPRDLRQGCDHTVTSSHHMHTG